MKKENNGITLIALVITIIVLLILAGVTVTTLTGENGLITRTGSAKEENLKAGIREKIQTESAGLEPERQLKSKTDNEIFQLLQGRLGLEEAQYNIGSKSMTITTKEGYIFTVLYDGTVRDGKFACLDIAEGSIQLKQAGYIQGQSQLVEYDGNYIITGTTTENIVEVKEEGTYNVTIKDLNIDVSGSTSKKTPFNANAGGKAQGCYVNITLEGNSVLYSKGMAGINFCGGRADTPVETNRSTLTIKGNGNLSTECKAGYDGAGIGGYYNAGVQVCDIVIDSGNITSIGRGDACGIGGGLRQQVGSIIINGGNIYAKGWVRSGIGSNGAIIDKVIINGGNITAIGGEYGGGICSNNKLLITGGIINATANYRYASSALGGNCKEVIIKGGTIISNADRLSGISCSSNGTINIIGGSLLINGNNLKFAKCIDSTSNIEETIPTDGTNNIYKTQIKLDDIGKNEKIASLNFSDNIDYGINDMYTLEGGMLYLYLPEGERTITIVIDGKTYRGTVNTDNNGTITTLQEV